MDTEREVQELDSAPKYSEQERLRLAQQVRTAREARGITQSELADMAGVGRGTIVNIESGKTIPQSSVIWRLMGALDMRPHVQPKLTPEVEGWLNLIAQTISDVDPVKRESIMVEALTLIASRARSL